MRARIEGGDRENGSAGCLPAVVQWVFPAAADYALPLSAFRALGWRGTNAPTIAQTLRAVQRVEATTNDEPAGAVRFSVGRVEFLADDAKERVPDQRRAGKRDTTPVEFAAMPTGAREAPNGPPASLPVAAPAASKRVVRELSPATSRCSAAEADRMSAGRHRPPFVRQRTDGRHLITETSLMGASIIDLTPTVAGCEAASCGARPLCEDAAVSRLGEARRLGASARPDRAAPVAYSRHGSTVGGVPGGLAAFAREPASNSCVTAKCALREWRRVEQCLAPIIGYGGVGAIYRRSLAVARAEFAWLPVAHEARSGRAEWAPLYQALARQAAPESSAADAALRRAFRHLSASLLGAPLARRLLAPRQVVGGADAARMEDMA